MEDIKILANKIPEMGNGGRKIKGFLFNAAKEVKQGNAIVDIAPFLGSTTAFLSRGLIDAGNKASRIYAIDKWEIEEKYRVWLKSRHVETTDLQASFVKNLQPFMDAGANIVYFKKNIKDFAYIWEPVQLLIDDIGIDKGITDCILKMFQPYFIPGLTKIFFMDFYFYEDFHDYKSRVYQRDLMNANKKVFEFIEHPKHSRTAIFRYLGGKINFIEGEQYYYDFKGCV